MRCSWIVLQVLAKSIPLSLVWVPLSVSSLLATPAPLRQTQTGFLESKRVVDSGDRELGDRSISSSLRADGKLTPLEQATMSATPTSVAPPDPDSKPVPTASPQDSNSKPVPAASPSPDSTADPKPTQPTTEPTGTTGSDKPPSSPPRTEAKPAPTKDEATEPTKTSEELKRYQILVEADGLYREGKIAEAEKLYRQVKPAFAGSQSPDHQKPDHQEPNPQKPDDQALDSQESVKHPAPFTDPAQLSPAGQVYWRESEAGLAQNLETRVMVPLKLLVEQYPEFIPGHIRLVQALKQYGHTKEALPVLERATTLYPNQPDLVKARVAALADNEQWIEASISARQFALLNPTDPSAPEMTQLADQNLKHWRGAMRSRLRGQAIAGVLTGALSYALTGNLFGPLSSIQTTVLLLQGENAVGDRVSRQAKRVLPLMDDAEVTGYLTELGQKLAKVAGRNFDYEFYVVMDDDVNAFALPGGKIYVNAGAILKANSEAELAGLLSHELSHAVLSHSFQLIADGNLTANLTSFIPYAGGFIGDLAVLDYSRDMERQADILGTRILASSGYAADGLYNLMVTLKQEEDKKGRGTAFSWLSSHPITRDRIRYLQRLIEQSGYNRYAYEGVERHSQIQQKVARLMKEYQQRKKKRGRAD